MRHPYWAAGQGPLLEAPVRDLPRHRASRRRARWIALRRATVVALVLPILIAVVVLAAVGAGWVAWRLGL
jgi:hypothetical protein